MTLPSDCVQLVSQVTVLPFLLTAPTLHLPCCCVGGCMSAGTGRAESRQVVRVVLIPPGPILTPGGSCTPGGSFGMFGTWTWAENSHFPALITSAACAEAAVNAARNTRLANLITFPPAVRPAQPLSYRPDQIIGRP